MARVQAAIYDLLIIRCRGYPLKLSRLLCHTSDFDEELAIFLSTPKCALDGFSQLIQEKLTSGSDTSKVLQQLRVGLEWLACTTYGCERLHSQNLRMVMSKRMTTGADAAQVAAVHMGNAAPSNFRWFFQNTTGSYGSVLSDIIAYKSPKPKSHQQKQRCRSCQQEQNSDRCETCPHQHFQSNPCLQFKAVLSSAQLSSQSRSNISSSSVVPARCVFHDGTCVGNALAQGGGKSTCVGEAGILRLQSNSIL
eukprot:6490560-Amphidinium_carterae.2